MAFDVFVSYASKDKLVADAVCARLESVGIRCWIAPRDIVAGTSYGESIIDAIHIVKVMVLVFSSSANASGHIPKEVERAVSNGVAILPFRIEDVMPGKSLDYFIGSVHWLDAMTPPLEKHLNDLATTVRKLLPVAAEEATAEQASRDKQGAHGVAATAAPMAAVRSAAIGLPRASAANTIWIGVAAVVVLAVVVMAVMLLRGGGSSPRVADVTIATNPPGDGTAAINSSPPEKASTPGSLAVPRLPPPSAEPVADPIVGCYQWFNNAQVVIRTDGTSMGGPFTGRWRRVSTARRGYALTWPDVTDTVTISPDQQSLKGSNQYGFPTSGARVAGSSGLAGTWRWPNGVPVTVYPNGAFSAASFRGKWRTIDALRGTYALTWPGPVDSVTLAADASGVSGANQYGVPVWGVRKHCSGN